MSISTPDMRNRKDSKGEVYQSLNFRSGQDPKDYLTHSPVLKRRKIEIREAK